jgi:uncharacterized protein YwgA
MSDQVEVVRDVVAAAGGRLVGKTRLQKTVYILKAAGLIDGFAYRYHYYGPYSEELSTATRDAVLDRAVDEREEVAQWGGSYSVFTTDYATNFDPSFAQIVSKACGADPITLELAATAAFLKNDGVEDCWDETRKRKPQKATDERIAGAKALWEDILSVETPNPLPAL